MQADVSWMEAGFTSPPEPGAMILLCGICDVEVHRTLASDLRDPAVIGDEAETACVAHLELVHPWRLRLWRRLGWRWLVAGMTA